MIGTKITKKSFLNIKPVRVKMYSITPNISSPLLEKEMEHYLDS